MAVLTSVERIGNGHVVEDDEALIRSCYKQLSERDIPSGGFAVKVDRLLVPALVFLVGRGGIAKVLTDGIFVKA